MDDIALPPCYSYQPIMIFISDGHRRLDTMIQIFSIIHAIINFKLDVKGMKVLLTIYMAKTQSTWTLESNIYMLINISCYALQ